MSNADYFFSFFTRSYYLLTPFQYLKFLFPLTAYKLEHTRYLSKHLRRHATMKIKCDCGMKNFFNTFQVFLTQASARYFWGFVKLPTNALFRSRKDLFFTQRIMFIAGTFTLDVGMIALHFHKIIDCGSVFVAIFSSSNFTRFNNSFFFAIVFFFHLR